MKYQRRVSLIVLYTPDKKILLQKRDMNAPTLPGYWGFFGGGIEKNEDPIKAVKREIYEELKIEMKDPIFLNRYEMEQGGGIVEKFIFLNPLTEPIEKLQEQQQEGEGLGLYKLDEIYSLKFPTFNWIILKDISNYFEKMNNNITDK